MLETGAKYLQWEDRKGASRVFRNWQDPIHRRLCDVKLKPHLQDFSLKGESFQHPTKEEPPRELFPRAQALKNCYSFMVQGGLATS